MKKLDAAIAQAWPRISVTSKLDGIRSWSLQALDTCPGSIESPGVLVDACKGCYATTGNYVFANVKAPREYNRTDWQRLDWCDNMVQELLKDEYFRWLDSGDLFSLALAEKVLEVMIRTPWVDHWLPTRMYKFPKFRQVLDAMRALPNVSVRFSADSVTGEYIEGLHGSVIGPSADTFQAAPGVSLCRAYEHEGRCNGCRACWDKSISLIAYPAHGRKMAKVIMMKQERTA
jgi:Gene product 88